MRKTWCFTIMILTFLLSACSALAEGIRQVHVNQVSVTYQLENGKWGFIDIPTGYDSGPLYDYIYDDCYDSESPIFVMKDGLYGYVNRTNGEIVIDFQFSSSRGYPCFRHGYALVSNVEEAENGSIITYDSFLIDTDGREIKLPDGYKAVTSACGTANTIIIGGIDANGKYRYGLYRIGEGVIIQPMFYEIYAGDCNYYCIRDDSGKIGLIDYNGNIVIEPFYTNTDSPIAYMSHTSQRGYTYLVNTGYYKINCEDGSIILILIDDNNCTYSVITITAQ